jgi:hypothetical protein
LLSGIPVEISYVDLMAYADPLEKEPVRFLAFFPPRARPDGNELPALQALYSGIEGFY